MIPIKDKWHILSNLFYLKSFITFLSLNVKFYYMENNVSSLKISQWGEELPPLNY